MNAEERAFLLAQRQPIRSFVGTPGAHLAVDAILGVSADIAVRRSVAEFGGSHISSAISAQALADDASLEPAFRAQLLATPGEDELAGIAYERAQAGRPGLKDRRSGRDPCGAASCPPHVCAERFRAQLEETRPDGDGGRQDLMIRRRSLRANARWAMRRLAISTLLGDADAYFAMRLRRNSSGAANMTDEISAHHACMVHTGAPGR